MRELTPEAAALMRAGRSAFRPGAADRDRVMQSLTQALGEAPVQEDAGRGGAGKSSLAQLTVKARIVGGLSVMALGAGLGAFVHARPAPPSVVRTASPAPSVAPAETSTPAAVPPPSEPAADPRLSHPTPSVPRPSSQSVGRAPADSLPEEVRLLTRAEKQLNAGLAGDALKTLAEHERRFPNGALAEERLAARVHALCELGRTGDARTEMARLGRAYPQSPQIERARRFCAMDANSAP